MHFIIQLFKELEDDKPGIKKYRRLVVDTYNKNNKVYCSPMEPTIISFNYNESFSAEIVKYINNFKTIHSLLMDFIDNHENTEESVQNLVQKSKEFAIKEDQNKLLELLLIINNIALYHFREECFFSKKLKSIIIE